ncbi:MAG: matrixin family metalloprotease [Bdellovibrionales bacterium]|nr:matrixin family metalloprotease [Bdellovibrionales bacterium]
MAYSLRRAFESAFLVISLLAAGIFIQHSLKANAREQVSISRRIDLAVKIVAHSDSRGPALSIFETKALMESLNKVWSQCNIRFKLEDYLVTTDDREVLTKSPQSMSDLPLIRAAFDPGNRFLVVVTGDWGKNGDIARQGADAWTTMPGNPPYGVVLDRTVSHNSNIVAHELGHYLGLFHHQDAMNLLSPVVSVSSRKLSADQCFRARAAAQNNWQKMIRP